MPEIQFLDLNEVKRLTTLSSRTIYRLRENENNAFPIPVRIGTRNLFLKSEILEWARARLAARPAKRQRTVAVNAKGTTVRPSAR